VDVRKIGCEDADYIEVARDRERVGCCADGDEPSGYIKVLPRKNNKINLLMPPDFPVCSL
jgi:hypothetical protein